MDVRQFDFLAAQPSAALKPRETFCGISKRALALLLVNVVFWQPIWAQADGIVVSSGGGNTRLDQAGNGVPIVNIATPGANGLSHNQFQDYNVDSRGVILNNVTDRTGNTQLGGIIVGNPNLKGAAAGVILNEVVGGSPSQLKGYTEVAGQSARVIVANPYGVTCNGCGFINTPRVTLTTGKPVLDGNRLDHFQVDGGSVSIEGNGLNADNVDQFDIVTRSAKINAELHARQLNVIAGRNDVAADSLAATPRAASPGDAPQLAIDSSALGGMYANTIRLVGTEAGVGVKLAGNLAASAGDIQLDANGQLTVAQAAASGNVVLKSQGIDAQGPVYAGGGINVQSGGDITVRQSVAARNAIVLSATGQLINGGIVEAGINPDNSRNATGDVTLQGAQLTNRGSVIASRTLTATTGGGLDNTGATLSGGNQVQLTAASVGNAQGRIQSRGNLNVQAATLDNTQGLVTSTGALSATLGQTSNGNGELSSQDRLTLQGQSFDNRQGKLIGTSGLDLTLSGNLDNRSGTLVSHGDLQARVSGTLDNRQQGNLQGAGNTILSFGQLLNAQGVLTSAAALSLSGNQVNNDGGQLGSQGNLVATLGSLDQLNGQFISQGQLSLIADRLGNTGNSLVAGQNGVELRVTAIDNRGGEVSSQSGTVSLTGQSLLNSGSKVIAGNDLNMAVTTVDNSASGLLSAKQDLRLNGQSLNNSAGGVLNAGASLQAILSGALDNTLGKLLAQGGLTLGSASLDNRQGLISSVGQQTLTVNGGALQNDGGRLVTDSGLTLSSTSLDNGTGTLSANGAVSLTTTGALSNAESGRLIGSDTFNVIAGSLTNAGRLASAKDLQVTTANLSNSGELFSQAGLTLDLQNGSLTNASGGLITAPGALVLRNLGDVRNTGELSSGQAFTLAAGSLDNSDGKLISNASLTLRIARALANAKGTLSATGLDIEAASLDNSAGVLTSHQDLRVTLAGDLLNGQGQLLSDGTLGITAVNLDNRQGVVSSAGQQTLVLAGGALRNANGQLVTDGSLTLNSGSLDNGAGTLSAKGAVTLITGELNNDQQGSLVSGGPLAITAQQFDNTTGLVSSGQALQLDLSGALDNTQGCLLGQSTLDLKATGLDNRQGRVSSVGQQTLTITGTVQNDGGQLVTDSGLSLSSASLDNGTGALSAKGAVSLSTTGALNNAQGGSLIGSDVFNVTAGSLTNGGRLASAKDLQVTTASLTNSGELFSQAGVTLDLQNGSLTNASGGLITAPGALLLNNLGTVRNAGELSSNQAFILAATSLDNSGGKLISNASLTLRIAHALTNAKGALSAFGLDLEAASLDNSAGVLTSHQDLRVKLAGDLLNGQGQLLSDGTLGLTAANLDNRQGLVSSAGQQTLTVTNGKVQNQGGQLVTDGSLTLSSAGLDNGAGTLSAKGAMSLTTGVLDNSQKGRLVGGDRLTVNAQRLDNTAGLISGAKGLQLTLSDGLSNGQGQLLSEGTLAITAANLDNRQGVISSAGQQTFTVSGGSVQNDGGQLVTDGGLTLSSASLDNGTGTLSAKGAVSLTTTGALSNAQGGQLVGSDQVSVVAGSLTNAGRLASAKDLQVTTTNLTNSGELFSQAGVTLDLQNGTLTNASGGLITAPGALLLNNLGTVRNAGELSSGQAFTLAATSLDNSGGKLVSNASLTLRIARALANAKGTLSAAGLDLQAGSLTNAGGTLVSRGALSVTTSGLLDNSADGLLSAATTLDVTASSLTNSGGSLLAQGAATITAGQVDNTAKGLINSQANLTLTADRLDSSNDGEISAKGDLHLTLGELKQQGGRLIGEGALVLDLGRSGGTGNLDNTGGLIASSGALGFAHLNQVTNAGGEISSAQSFDLIAQALDNSKGKLISQGLLKVQADQLTNDGGLLSGWQGLTVTGGNLSNRQSGTLSSKAGDLAVTLSGTLDNGDNGALVSQGALTITTGNLNNTGGVLSSGGAQTLSVSGTLQNGAQGLIDSGTSLIVNAGQFSNAGGLTQAKQALSVSTGNLDNRGGTLNGQQTVTLDLLGALTNTNGAVLAQGDLLLKRATQVSNAQGRLNSGGLLTLLVGGLDNSNGGTLASQGDLSITTSGQVSNGGDGLLASQGGALSITAGGLDNSGGTLQSATGLTLAIGSGTVGNVGGKLLAQNGDLSITAGNLDNRGGILASLQGAFTAGISGLLANGGQGQTGGTIQAQRLDLSAGTLSNYNGKLTALGGDALFQIGSLDNRNGSLYGKGLVRVRGGSFDNSGDNDGQVFGNQIDFSLSGALNNRLGIIESNSTLSLAAASLDNTNGRLRALGSGGSTLLNLGGTLDNTNGRLESANQDLQLNLGGLINANGTLLHVGNGTFGLGLPLLQDAGGSITSNGTLTLSGSSWTNSSTLQVANLVVNVDNLTQTGSGQLLARNSFSGNGGNWTNDGLIASGGAFSLYLGGTYQGAGRLSSAGDFTLGAGQLLLDNPNARLNGSGTTTINIGGLLRNQARIAAAGDFNLSAGQVDNQGTLGAAGNLSITTANLTNQNSSLIFSGGNMGLWVNDFTNKYADIYSLGSLSIARAADGSWANTIVNRSGNITSDGSLLLAGNSIQNIRDVLTVNNEGIYTAEITEKPCDRAYVGDCKGSNRNGLFEVTQRDKLEVTAASAGSSITSGQDLTVHGGTLLNSSSTIATGGNLTASVDTLTNEGVVTGSTETSRTFVTARHTLGSHQDEAATFTDKYWYESPNYLSNDLSGLEAALAHFISTTESEVHSLQRTKQIANSDASYSAVIQAGGAVNVRASNDINNSVVRPGYTYVSGGRRTDTSAPGTAYATVVTLNPQLPPNLAQQQVNPTTLPGFNLPTGQNGLFRLSGQQNSDTDVKVGSQGQWLTSSQVTVDNQLGVQNSTYTAGRTQDTSRALESTQVAVVAPLQVQKQNDQALLSAQLTTPATLSNKAALDTTPQAAKAMDATTSQPTAVVSQQHGTNAAESAPKDVSTPMVSVALPTTVGHDLPHRYLVETNPALTDLKQFLSSDYLLGNLAYNPDTSWKRLGDGLYEQRLIQQAIVARTGQRFIDGLTSDEAQFKYLMDNAIASKQALGLSVGVGLTAEQVAALTHDIVWMEDQVVNGQHVLVPVLYLAQANNRLAANGALIQGSDVTLIAGNDLNNAGTLKATNSLSATATNNLVNSGLIQAGDRLSLLAGENLTNRAGGILSGRDVDLTTIRGDILNERTVTSHQSASGANSWREDFADSAARIEAANNLTVQAGRDFSNVGGVLSSGRDLSITAGRDVNLSSARTETGRSSGTQFNTSSITQLGSSTTAGQNLSIHAGRDLSATASTLSAGKDLDLSAKHDLTLSSAANETHSYSTGKKVTSQEDHVSQQSSTLKAGGSVTMAAGQDLTIVASKVEAGKEAYLYAGRDLNLLADHNEDYSFYSKTKKSSGTFSSSSKTTLQETHSVAAIGSSITAGQTLTLVAGHDLTAQGAAVTSTEGALKVQAANDINLISAGSSYATRTGSGKSSSGLLSSSSKITSDSNRQTVTEGTTFSGDTTYIKAGHDLNIAGSNVVSTNQTTLVAGNNVNIESATQTTQIESESKQKRSGLMSTGGIGVTLGSSVGSSTQNSTTQSQQGSTVGSVLGNVNIIAGKDLTVKGSDLVAGNDISLVGQNVNILAAQNQNSTSQSQQSKKGGLTLALSGTVGSAVNSAVQNIQQARQGNSGDSRLNALQGMQAGLSSYQAWQAAQLADASSPTGQDGSYWGISLSLGSQSSHSNQSQLQTVNQGSSITAGHNLSIVATGSGQGANDGDINVQGSRLKASNDLSLDANRDINLFASADTQQLSGNNSSSGGNVGVSIGGGTNGYGISVFANANSGKGFEKGTGTSWNETTLDAGNQVKLKSGRDTSLIGAQVSGNQITADVGRDLLLRSLQDSNGYDARQQSANGGLSFTFGSMTLSGNLNVSQDKLRSNFNSVQEQTGLFAGNGGYQINVGQHTQLDGAVIGSTASADKNSLDTGTLGWTDLRNRADFSVEHQGAGFSSGGSATSFIGNMANSQLVGANSSGHDSSTTYAAVSSGNLTIRDAEHQKQDTTALDHDVEHAANNLSPIFDKEKEQRRLQQVQLIADIGTQSMDIIRTQGQIEATKAIKDPKAQEDARISLAAKGVTNPTSEQIAQQITNTVMQQYGTGSNLQVAAQAVSSALQGLAGGNLGAAISGAAAPYLAQTIKDITGGNVVANTMAHAVLGAVVAQAQGNSAVSGAAGAAVASTSEFIASQLYPGVPADKLDESQKQTVSALVTLAAGLAGGVLGGGAGNAIAGAQAGQNAVNNNHLSPSQAIAFDKELQGAKTAAQKEAVLDKYDEINEKNRQELIAGCEANPTWCADYAHDVVKMGLETAQKPSWLYGSMTTDEAKAFVTRENSEDLNYIDKTTPAWAKFVAYVADPLNQADLVLIGGAAADLIGLARNSIRVGESAAAGSGAALDLGAANIASKVVAPEAGKTTVYASVTEDGITQYVGITDSLAARRSAHAREKDILIEPIPGLTGISRSDARAVEQVLIEFHGLAKNDGTLLNLINSISKTNPTYAASLERGRELLRSVNYKGF